jgi:uncharacterized protein (DUF433 family)
MILHPFHEGNTAEKIVSHYPALRPADVYAVISYCQERLSREQE